MIGQVGRSPLSQQQQQQQQHQTLQMEQANELGGVDNFLFSRDPTKASFISASTLASQEEMMGIRTSNDDESGDMNSHCSSHPTSGNEQQTTPTDQQQQFFDVVEAESPGGRMRIASTLLGNNQAGISYLAQYLSATPSQQESFFAQQQPVLTMEGNSRKRPHEPTVAQLLQSHKQQHQSHPGDRIQLEEDRLLASLLGTGASC